MSLRYFIILFQLVMVLEVIGQEKTKTKVPLFVSHLSEENAAVTRRKGAPKHYFLSKVICFKLKCRAFIGWRTTQRNKRYDYNANNKRSRKKKMNPDTIGVMQDKPIKNMPIKKTDLPVPVSLKSDSIIVLNELLFEVNSYQLNKELFPTLDSIATYLSKQPQATVNISGHTDNTGKEDYNLTLSSQRAEAVAEYLLDKGVNPDRVTFEGLGSALPILPNDTAEGRRKNRRVEILIRGKR